MNEKKMPRGIVTFLVTEIADSNRIADALGNADYERLVLIPHRALLQKAVQEEDGCLLHDNGDGVFAAFHTPRQGLNAAIAIQQGLDANPIIVQITDIKTGLDEYKTIALRIGIHRSERDLFPIYDGATISYPGAEAEIAYALRIMDSCWNSQILVSDTLRLNIDRDKTDTNTWKDWPNRGLKSLHEDARTVYEFLWDGASKGEPGSHWLPEQLMRDLNVVHTPFIGREAEIASVRRWLLDTEQPLLAIHGVNGLGKTRLAVETVLQLGSYFPGGIAFVSLESATEGSHPEEVTPELLKYNLRDGLRISHKQDGVAEELHAWLQNRVQQKGRVLLALDKWECAQNAATLVWLNDLATSFPDVYVLLTSRFPLELSNITLNYPLPFMQTPPSEQEPVEEFDSGQLFLERVRRLANSWQATPANGSSINRILNVLQGHPLAIELVAARAAKSQSLDEIAESLEKSLLAVRQDRCCELRDEVLPPAVNLPRSEPDRHESLEAALNWTIQCLSPESRVAFHCVGVFPIDFSSQMAHCVADINPDWLMEWRSASLLHVCTLFGKNRYEALPVVQEYCNERLGEAREAYERRYVDWCFIVAKGWEAPEIAEKMTLSAEGRNLHIAAGVQLRSVCAWGDASRLVWFGNALLAVTIGNRDSNLRRAIACYESALRVFTEKAFPQDWAMTQNNLGIAYSKLPSGNRDSNLQNAIVAYKAALRYFTEQAFPQQWATTLNNLGSVYANLSSGDRFVNLQNAIECYGAALRVYKKESFPQPWAMTQQNLGNAYQSLPSLDQVANLHKAIAYYEAALSVYTGQAFRQEWTTAQFNLALAREKLGDRTGAQQTMLRAISGCQHVEEAHQANAWMRKRKAPVEAKKGISQRFRRWLCWCKPI